MSYRRNALGQFSPEGFYFPFRDENCVPREKPVAADVKRRIVSSRPVFAHGVLVRDVGVEEPPKSLALWGAEIIDGPSMLRRMDLVGHGNSSSFLERSLPRGLERSASTRLGFFGLEANFESYDASLLDLDLFP